METTGMTMIDTPEKFVEWCRDNGGGVKLQRRGAGIITEYLSAHGQMLSANGEGELFLNSEAMTEKTSLDEVVDQVCDWNYRELVDTRCRKENPADFLDYCKSCTMEKELEEHKFILDRIFKQTVYGREIRAMAHKLALEMMKEMHLVPAFDMKELQETGTHDKAVGKSAESVEPDFEEMDEDLLDYGLAYGGEDYGQSYEGPDYENQDTDKELDGSYQGKVYGEDKDNSKMLAGPASVKAVGEPGIVGINPAGNAQSSMVGFALEEIVSNKNNKKEGRAR